MALLRVRTVSRPTTTLNTTVVGQTNASMIDPETGFPMLGQKSGPSTVAPAGAKYWSPSSPTGVFNVTDPTGSVVTYTTYTNLLDFTRASVVQQNKNIQFETQGRSTKQYASQQPGYAESLAHAMQTASIARYGPNAIYSPIGGPDESDVVNSSSTYGIEQKTGKFTNWEGTAYLSGSALSKAQATETRLQESAAHVADYLAATGKKSLTGVNKANAQSNRTAFAPAAALNVYAVGSRTPVAAVARKAAPTLMKSKTYSIGGSSSSFVGNSLTPWYWRS